MFDIILAMAIHILVIDGAFDVGLTAILDTLSLANELIPTLGVKVEPLEVCLVGARRHVSTAHGLKVPCAAPSTLGRADAAVVPALGAKQPAQLMEALGSKDVRNAQGLLREYRQDNALIGAACTSTFVLAEGGASCRTPGHDVMVAGAAFQAAVQGCGPRRISNARHVPPVCHSGCCVGPC